MILIVCIDDNKGMMFNHRRQSQDGVLRRHILDMVGNGKLWMNEYSGKMFAKDSEELLHGPVQTDEDFLKKASSGEYCFVETNSCGLDMFPDTANIEAVVLYKWNRVYPADQYCLELLNLQVLPMKRSRKRGMKDEKNKILGRRAGCSHIHFGNSLWTGDCF